MIARLLILLLFISSVVKAQDSIKKDSLMTLLKEANEDTTKVRILYTICKLYHSRNADSTLLYGSKALQLNEKLGNSASPLVIANINLAMGAAYRQHGNFKKCLMHYQGAEVYAEKSQDTRTIGLVQLHLSQYYQLNGLFNKALPYLHDAIKKFIAAGDSSRMMEATVQLGVIQKELKQFDEAEKNLKEAASYGISKNKMMLQYTAIGQLALLNSVQGKHAEAIKYINQNKALAEQTQELSDHYWMLGNEYLALKNYRLALSSYLQGLPIAEEDSVSQITADYYDMLSQTYAGIKDYHNAYHYASKSMALKDTIYDLAKQEELIQMQEQYESEKKDKEILLLNKDKALKSEEADKQRLIRNVFIGGLIVTLLFVIVLYNRYRIKQRTARQLEEKNIQVEKARERAEQSERYKSQFLANMSHEIRTPMNAVIGMSYLLEETRLDEKQRRYINAIKNSSENLLVIINDVLDLSKLEAGRMELEKIPFKLDEVLNTVYNTLRYKAEENGLSLTINYDNNVCNFLLGDPLRLTQVLLNLTSNAIKFTENGIVKISVENSGDSDKKKCSLKFLVTDTGVGIAKDKQHSIFEAFKQESEGTSRKYGGTGLGLSISQQIIQLHGSSITVESQPGKGSTFSFSISYDITSAAAFENKFTATENFDFLKGIRILLAEDNEYNQEVAVQSLMRYVPDLKIDVANDGNEVLLFLAKNNYDIILMDVQMPGMDGYEATKRIRESGDEKSNIPIIALTASATREEINLGFKAGMNAYVAKPFKPVQLLIKIAEQIKSITPVSDKSASTTSTILEEITGGNREQMKTLIDRFRTESILHFENMERALTNGNTGEIKTIVHIFHPQATTVGLNELSFTLQQMSRMANESDASTLMLLLNKAKEQYAKATIF